MTTLPLHDEPSQPREAAGLKTRIAVLAAVILPFAALGIGVWLAWGRAFDWWQLGIVALMYLISGLGVTLGYHRLFTHCSFETSRPMHALLGVMAGTAAEGGLLGGLSDLLFGTSGPRGGKHEGLAQTAARSAMRSVGSAVGREIVRGVLGSILGSGRRR